jgi:hypothetical protein
MARDVCLTIIGFEVRSRRKIHVNWGKADSVDIHIMEARYC